MMSFICINATIMLLEGIANDLFFPSKQSLCSPRMIMHRSGTIVGTRAILRERFNRQVLSAFARGTFAESTMQSMRVERSLLQPGLGWKSAKIEVKSKR
jgi:hypothetical protein